MLYRVRSQMAISKCKQKDLMGFLYQIIMRKGSVIR